MKKKQSVFLFLFILWLSPQAATDTNSIELGVFSKCLERGLPIGWEKFKEIKGVSLQTDSSGYCVNITSIGDVEGIGKRKEFSLKTHPWLHWRWKARVLPTDANEKIKKKNDSAAGLYVAFKGMFPFNHVIKYTWSTTLPIGAIVKSPHHGGTRAIIIQSGPGNLNTWMQEKRNVYEDYRLAFGSEPPLVEGIAIQTDSDNTHSSASADFADIFVSAHE